MIFNLVHGLYLIISYEAVKVAILIEYGFAYICNFFFTCKTQLQEREQKRGNPDCFRNLKQEAAYFFIICKVFIVSGVKQFIMSSNEDIQ